jgi:hypothetical protein
MTMLGPWLLATALELLADGVDDATAAAKLVSAARGNRDSLRGAYARALALAGELPDDRAARRAVELLTRAMRGQFDSLLPVDMFPVDTSTPDTSTPDTSSPVDTSPEATEDLGQHRYLLRVPRNILAPRGLRVWEQAIGGVAHGVH